MASRNKNVKNAESNLFKRLTRLFSGPIVQYRAQTPRKEKRRLLDKYKFTSASGQNFKKTEYDAFAGLNANAMANQGRQRRYVDFDQMEFSPEISSALDIYADEMTTSNSFNELLTIKCPNEEIKSILDGLYYNIMNLEFNLFGYCRTLCKYGDFFLYLDIDDQKGIQNTIGLSTEELERLEGEDKTNPNYVQFQWNSGGITFENWQILHFRILGNDRHTPYGTSVLDGARRIWRQLTLLEDAMMAYRIVRSPERRIFYIDVGNIPAQDVEQYMQKVMTQMKRNQVIDPDTGRVDLRYNPMSIEEDYFIPVQGGVSSKIENLPGGTYTGDIDDVKYLREKMFSALKIPQSYLAAAEGAEIDRTTLAQKDIRFSRTIQRLQRAILPELEKAGIIHLYTLGFRGDDLVSFKLQLNNPSKLAELQELEHMRTKFEVANAAVEGYYSRRWIADNILNVTNEEFQRNQIEMFYDKKHDAMLERVGEEVLTEGEPIAGGGDLAAGEDLTGLEGGDEGMATDDELAGIAAEETAEEEPETGILATPDEPPPGSRDDRIKVGPNGKYTKKGWKGATYWSLDQRGGKKVAGPLSRSNAADSGMGSVSNLPSPPRSSSLIGLKESFNGTSDNGQSNYNEEEDRVLTLNYELKQLVDNMELHKNESKAQQEEE